MATTTSAYQQGLGIVTAITDKTGVEFRLEPQGTDTARATALRDKAGDFLITTQDSYLMYNGIGGFAEPGWGPQDHVRVLWIGGMGNCGFMIRGDSGIKSVQDLRGKKVATYPTYPWVDMATKAWLAFGGLTWDDVIPVKVGSFANGGEVLMDGGLDACYYASTSPIAQQLESSIHGVGWIPLPHADKEGWSRLFSVTTGLFPVKETVGAGLSLDKPWETTGYCYGIVCYDWLDDNEAYWLTKQFNECYSLFKDKHIFLPRWNIIQALDPTALPTQAPYHPASVQYFKDIGRWTPELDKIQANNLARK